MGGATQVPITKKTRVPLQAAKAAARSSNPAVAQLAGRRAVEVCAVRLSGTVVAVKEKFGFIAYKDWSGADRKVFFHFNEVSKGGAWAWVHGLQELGWGRSQGALHFNEVSGALVTKWCSEWEASVVWGRGGFGCYRYQPQGVLPLQQVEQRRASSLTNNLRGAGACLDPVWSGHPQQAVPARLCLQAMGSTSL